MTLFHISHTDLDGYGCQFLTKEYFKEGFFLNANYGLEVRLSIDTVIQEIQKEKKENVILFLITDVNLTCNEAKDLDSKVNNLKKEGYNINLQLLDHHGTGQKSSEIYEWYYLDTKRCATKIVFDYLNEHYKAFLSSEYRLLEKLVDCINAVDIWLENEHNNFEFGKVLLSMISKVREVNNVLFSNENRLFRFYLLKEAMEFINKDNNNILLDDAIHGLKKRYLNLDGKNDTLDNLSAKFLVHSIVNIKEQLSINYQGHKGVLTYCLGAISIPANAFLKANDEFDFFMDINKKGTISFRADGKLDVSALAQKLANGGGHPNAAGCKLEDFKESLSFIKIKEDIQKRLEKI